MSRSAVVTLFDVDNTLVDNDHIVADMRRHLERTVGEEQQTAILGAVRAAAQELGYADYLGRPAALPDRGPAPAAPARGVDVPRELSVRQSAVPRLARRRRARASWGRSPSSPTATSCSSRSRCTAPGCSRRSRATCSSTSTRSASWPTSSAVSRRALRLRGRQAAALRRHQGATGASASPPCSRARATTRTTPAEVARYPPPDVTLERIGDFVGWELRALRPRRRAPR